MPRPFPGDAFAHLQNTARLEVPDERAELVRATAESVYALLDELDSLELGETAPATAFNARWE
ncbi:hypothetical protein [Amycolatopsis alkalitolerans]|uniref:Uncharacterized protein n=1 Tax=Amycolatopsis alkalitolerans TaxID=2547244 RepID=A0A5C4LZX4_9PSEU|nr:hypothetical protein [Amycolatopsis alkalitolerans]TNC24423.1 hypothetical protein FG385_18565 [Amycolatopsis alkalitolerans]